MILVSAPVGKRSSCVGIFSSSCVCLSISDFHKINFGISFILSAEYLGAQ
jgi:hypothetical protein